MKTPLKRLKNFVHQHETLEAVIFLLWSAFCILRAHIIFKKIRPPAVSHKKVKIVIPTIVSLPVTNLVYFDAIFCHAFRAIGCDAKILFQDDTLPSYEGDTIMKTLNAHKYVSNLLAKSLKKSMHVPTASYRDYVSQEEITKIKQYIDSLPVEQYQNCVYKNARVGAQARASTIRYFLSGSIDPANNGDHARVFKKKLLTAMITAHVAFEIVTRERPDMLLLTHGLYATWGPFLDIFKKHGVEVVVHNPTTFRFGCFTFNRNDTEFALMSKDTWNVFQNHALTKTEKHEIESYLKNRIHGTVCDQTMFQENYNPKTKKEILLRELFHTPETYKKTYIMYTGLSWDAVIFEREAAFFNDLFEWLDATIKHFKYQPQLRLIIKPHPAEIIWEKGTRGVASYIHGRHLHLPRNIIVLPVDTPVTAYDLTQPGCVGITYNGTIGLEMATRGLPVIVAGRCHYTDAHIAYPIISKEHYLETISNPLELEAFARANQERAKRYAYFYFCKIPVQVPFFDINKWATIDWKKIWNIETLLSKNSTMLRIVRRMVERKDIVNPI